MKTTKPPPERGFSSAGVLDICSNHCVANFNPGQLKKLAVPGDRENGSSNPESYRAQALPKRLGPKKVADIVRKYQAGESARSLAEKHKVAPSAMTRLLRENNVVVKKRKVTEAETQALAKGYKAGATMRELEAKHELSHGAVLRALRRAGVEMRAKAPRKR